jgi:hypothetical protein
MEAEAKAKLETDAKAEADAEQLVQNYRKTKAKLMLTPKLKQTLMQLN